MVDALHAALALYLDEGITAVQRFFARTNLFNNPDFTQFVELALKMLPAASDEHKALSDLLMSDVKLRSYVQMPLFGASRPRRTSSRGCSNGPTRLRLEAAVR